MITINLSIIPLSIIFLYLFLGNLPRFLQITGFKDNLLVTEFIIYIILILYAILSKRTFNLIWKLGIVYFIVFFSFLYGIFINGFELKPFLYNLRLMLILFSATTAGYVLYDVYKANIIKVSKYIVNIYFCVLLLSFVIFFVFSHSKKLWVYLEQFGIVFHGDPHINRLVSTYLDPNYYSAIACFPLIICIYLYKVNKEIKHLLIASLLIGSIFLSASRSGVVTMLALLLLSNWDKITILKTCRIHKNILYSGLIILFISLLLGPFYINSFMRVIERIMSVTNDASALARLRSFEFGMSIFYEHPFMGIGYNYLCIYTEKFRGLSSIDSSVQATLINFGLIFTFILSLLFLLWVISVWLKLKMHSNKNKDNLANFYSMYIIYIIIVVIFTSQFNNVLYYQFWLFPVVMVGTYLTILSEEGKKCM